jgi:hypothetical protein
MILVYFKHRISHALKLLAKFYLKLQKNVNQRIRQTLSKGVPRDLKQPQSV